MKTLLFGAGASIPFFNPRLTTDYLTSAVVSRENWQRVVERLNHASEDEKITPLLYDEVVTIVNQLKDFYSYHFEQITEILDKLASYNFDSLPCDNMMNSLLSILGVNRPDNTNWKYIPFLVRQIIAEAIIDLEHQHHAAEYDTLIRRQREFIACILQSDEDVSLMSLNYDDCLLDSLSGLDVDNCFEEENADGGHLLNVKRFFNAHKLCYFLHGHLRFRYIDTANLLYYGSAEVADNARWEHIRQSRIGSNILITPGKFSYNFNTSIVTGQMKDDVLNLYPYSLFYQRLAIDIVNSDTIYIVGYSFGDEHINRLLNNFINRHNGNRILVVDYYTNDVTMTNEFEDTSNIIYKIHQTTKTPWYINENANGNQTPDNPGEVEAINSRGWGEIFRNVVFYKKGYAEFLDERHNVIYG